MYTAVFNCFIFMNVFNLFNARILDQTEVQNNIKSAWLQYKGYSWFFGILMFVVLAQIFFVQFGGKLLRCSPLSFNEWGLSLIFGFGTILWHMLVIKISEKRFECFIRHIPVKQLVETDDNFKTIFAIENDNEKQNDDKKTD